MRSLIPLFALLAFASNLRADDLGSSTPSRSLKVQSLEVRAVLGTYASRTGTITISNAGYGAAFVSGDRWQSVGFYQDSAYTGVTRRVGPDNRSSASLDQGLLYFRLQPDGRISAELGWAGSKASIAELWTRADENAPNATRPLRPGEIRPPDPRPVVDSPPPSVSESPKFGDYVYVEELPEAITKVQPIYPDMAREAKVEGTVLVQALVGKDGKVKDVRVVKGLPMLDSAAMTAVKQWIFKPALSKGQPVEVWVALPVKFPPY